MRGLATSRGGALARGTNWAGYVLPSTRVVTEVGGAWTVPALDCSVGSDAHSSIWVGIGGNAGESDPLLELGLVGGVSDRPERGVRVRGLPGRGRRRDPRDRLPAP